MQMVRVNKGRSVDLEAVVVLVGVLEQAVHWVQHLMGQQKEPFPLKKMNMLSMYLLNYYMYSMKIICAFRILKSRSELDIMYR